MSQISFVTGRKQGVSRESKYIGPAFIYQAKLIKPGTETKENSLRRRFKGLSPEWVEQ